MSKCFWRNNNWKNISLNAFNDIESIPTINGKCIKNTLFTPDDKYYYECNNEDVGMPCAKVHVIFH